MAASNNFQTLAPSLDRSRWLAVGLFLLALVPGPLALGWLVLLGCDPYLVNDASARLPLGLTVGPAFAVLGGLIFGYRPHNRIGWLCLVLGFCLSTNNAIDLYAQCGLAGTIAAPGKAYAAWLLYSYGNFAILPLIFLLPMVYPTGRFLSPRWRWFTVASLIVLILIYTGMGLVPDLSRSNGMDRFPVANPWGVLPLPGWWFSVFYSLTNLSFVFLNLVGVAAMVVRFRRSVGDERQQMKWLAYFLTIAIGIQMLFFNLPAAFWYPRLLESAWFDVVLWLVFLGFPIVIGIAIFKYRLYAIDIIINRTLVYGGLTLLITAAYVLFVGGIGTLAANQSGQVIGLVVGTAIVVVGIRPLHHALQMNVNRFVTVSPMVPIDEQLLKATKSLPPPNRPPSTSLGRRSPSQPHLRWLTIALLLVALIPLLVMVSLILAGCAAFAYLEVTGISIASASSLAFSILGVLIFAYQPYNRIGWLCLWIGIGLLGVGATDLYASCGLAGHIAAPGSAYLAWFSYSFGVFFPLVPMFILLPMMYPTGKFLSPRWQWITVAGLIGVAINGAAMGLLPDLSRDNGFETLFNVANPFGIAHLPDWWYSFFSSSSNLTLLTLSLMGITAMVVRFRRSLGDERQQMKWLAYFLGTAVVAQLLFFELPGAFFYPEIFSSIWYVLILLVVFLGFPVIIGIAIFKYRLYAIDIIINRTLVYGGLTLLITVVYVFLVGGISTVTANQSGQVMGLVLATGIVAVGVRPLHRSLQATVDRVIAVPDLPPVGEPMNEPTLKMTDPARSRPFVRWLALLSWILVASLHITLLGFDLVRDYSHILTVCTGPLGMFGGCDQLAVSAAEVAVLSSWGLSLQQYALYMLFWVVLGQLIYLSLGLLILWQQGMSKLGLTVSLALIVIPFSLYSGGDEFGSIHPLLFVPGLVAAFIGPIIMMTFVYLVPNGRFSPRWAYIPLICTLVLMFPLLLQNVVYPFPDWAASFVNTTSVGAVLLAIVFQVYRYAKQANSVERQQTKWISFGVVILALTVILWVPIFGGALSIPSGRPRLLANASGWTFLFFGQYFLPIAIAIAIFRYKLWNIDVIINRTLVYGGLTLTVVLIYILTVGGLGLLFQTSGNFVISLLATALIAIAFQPVRERLQRGVNRFMFGQRDDPYAVLSHLSQQLQTTAVPTETLTSIVETIAATLKLPYAAIELIEQETQVGQAAVGEPVGETVELPLRYQKETVGRLLVSPRAPGEKFTIKEQQLLADIAAQTGPVASATRLTLALQRSREKLVLAREEERRRIRRDLHDGLGPTLASQTLKLDIVLDMLTSDPATAGQHVSQLKAQTQQMVADIRRLVYELRPPALDELGLLEA
ncbi:MAG: histidine kinase dimerization/phosphoacceptor domain-containing protein, partial [Anaerolineae bacterium]|nr:histidine kinase dimerization/phosphoacceptor domain-containing protein [Anaerolineae bacterium]